MIKERMLELLVLNEILKAVTDSTKNIEVCGKEYDLCKLTNRTKILLEEFLEPYVIESDPKG